MVNIFYSKYIGYKDINMENEKDLKIDLLVPGTALREGLKIISESGTGAFIVVGSST